MQRRVSRVTSLVFTQPTIVTEQDVFLGMTEHGDRSEIVFGSHHGMTWIIGIQYTYNHRQSEINPCIREEDLLSTPAEPTSTIWNPFALPIQRTFLKYWIDVASPGI